MILKFKLIKRFIITSAIINGESRKLRVKWTPELYEDLTSYHNMKQELIELLKK